MGASLLALAGLQCHRSNDFSYERVRTALGELRLVQPRLVGLGFAVCTASDHAIPQTSCPDASRGALKLRNALRQLSLQATRALSGQPSSHELWAAALLTVALEPRNERSLLSALAFLDEAFEREPSVARRAQILSDVSAIHHLLAETLQSHLELGAALEASTRSLELEPSGVEARFNRQLALHLLGIERIDAQGQVEDPHGDPWIEELRSRFVVANEDKAEEDQLCSSSAQDSLDRWSRSFVDGRREPLRPPPDCVLQMDDQYWARVWSDAQSQPNHVAPSWLRLRDSELALQSFELEAAENHLAEMPRQDALSPIGLWSTWIRARLNYQRAGYDEGLRSLAALAADSQGQQFFELSAYALRLSAVIHQIRGDYGIALEFLETALHRARQADSPGATAAVQSALVEQQWLVGREDEAWSTTAGALAELSSTNQIRPRLNCLFTAARLAVDRSLPRVAGALLDQAIVLSRQASPVAQIAALKERGEHSLERGQIDSARADLTTAQQLLRDLALDPQIVAILTADLQLLEGRVVDEPSARQQALEPVLANFLETDYDRRLLVAQLAMARALHDQDRVEEAKQLLRDSLDRLRDMVAAVSGQTDAAALVAAARPTVEQLLAWESADPAGAEVRITLAAYFAMASGRPELEAAAPSGFQRLTYFVAKEQLFVLFESAGRTVLKIHSVESRSLADARERLLLLLRSESPSARIRATADSLAEVLLKPVASHLDRNLPLVVVADSVLAGVPFSLLPLHGDQLLVDEFVISYSTNLGSIPPQPDVARILVVGTTAAESDQPTNLGSVEEARQVAALYPEADLMLERQATPSAVVEAMEGAGQAHFAGHFVADPRRPTRSYFVMSGSDGTPDRLVLADLLAARQAPLDLLYLSGCDTGRGLPATASGIYSLAQLFSGPQIGATVVSLWPLRSDVGSAMALEFHRQLRAGKSAPEALRSAQLSHRSQPLHLWAPLAIYL